MDFVNLLPGYPQPFGSFAKMQIRERRVLCGGQTAAMCTCASLGLRSKYVGVSGTDENGRRIRQELARRNVDVTDLIIRDAENQFAVILVDETTGERIVLWDRDDRLRLRDRELPAEAFAAARVIHVDDVDEDAAIRRRCSAARPAPSSRISIALPENRRARQRRDARCSRSMSRRSSPASTISSRR